MQTDFEASVDSFQKKDINIVVKLEMLKYDTPYN